MNTNGKPDRPGNVHIDLNKLIIEEPLFVSYSAAVIAELTGVTPGEWLYHVWKAYVTGMTPAEFVSDWVEDDDDNNQTV